MARPHPRSMPMSADEKPVSKAPRGRPVMMGEVGVTGLRHQGGVVDEERLPALRWPQAAQVYRQMAENDAVVGAVLYAIRMLVRNVDWKVEPFSADNAEDAANAEFVEECRNDMSQGWTDVMSEAMGKLVYGFHLDEIVYKRRNGDNRRPGLASAYDDNRIGWRKLPTRAAETVERWEFDEDGGLQAAIQTDPNGMETYTLPIHKLLLFRTEAQKGSPQGQSILRTAYRAWILKKTIEEYEAIRIERSAVGIPVAWVPAELTLPDADGEAQAMFSSMQKIVRNLKFNEQAGVVMPLAYDESGNKMYDLTLMSLDQRGSQETDKIITRWDSRIAMTALADFILIGHQNHGSFSLVHSRSNLFAFALGAYLKSIAEVFNRHALPRLFRLNGLPTDRLPRIVPGDVESVDLADLGDFIVKLAGAGAPLFPNHNLEAALLSLAGLPEPPETGGTLGTPTPLDPETGDMMAVAPGGVGSTRRLPRAEADAVDTSKGDGSFAALDPESGWFWRVRGDAERAGHAVHSMKKRHRRNLVLTRFVGVHEDGSMVFQKVPGRVEPARTNGVVP